MSIDGSFAGGRIRRQQPKLRSMVAACGQGRGSIPQGWLCPDSAQLYFYSGKSRITGYEPQNEGGVGENLGHELGVQEFGRTEKAKLLIFLI